MNLNDISEMIDEKIDTNDKIIIYTYYELRIKHNLSVDDMNFFLLRAKTRLKNMGYNVYSPGQKYIYDYGEKIVKDNELLIAIKQENNKK